MNSGADKEISKNLLVKLAEEKAAAQAQGKRYGILGKDLSKRFNVRTGNQSYTWRGGRNGQGKP